jgi:hypothetical protein
LREGMRREGGKNRERADRIDARREGDKGGRRENGRRDGGTERVRARARPRRPQTSTR